MWEQLDIQLRHLVRRQTFREWNIRPRYISDYELVLVLKGFGNIMIAGKDICVKEGDLICFRPGVEHSLWVTREPYMEFYGVHFVLPGEKEPLPFPDLIQLKSPMHLEMLFKNLHDVWRQKGYLYEWRQSLLLQQILCEIFMLLHEKEDPMQSVRIRKVLDFIHEDPCRPLTLEQLLQQAGIRKTLFMQSFRNVTGTTPTQYIIRLRLENARDLLLDSDLPIAQIAEKCGFADSFYFSRCFRKHFSMSPRQYRESMR